ncbi:MAG: hypothetical protein HFH68_01610 [Lachnospiraceae bacterium]|nr:hypothetical protein [Lachnospiraceae bacterium]
MEQIHDKMLELLLSYAKEAGWSYILWEMHDLGHYGCRSNIETFVSLEKISHTEEDLFIDISFDMGNPVGSFLENLKKYVEGFMVNYLTENLVSLKGEKVCPNEIKELVDDAEIIQGTLDSLFMVLSANSASLF